MSSVVEAISDIEVVNGGAGRFQAFFEVECSLLFHGIVYTQ